MDLQTSVFLLFILFTAGHSLSCYKCRSMNDTCANQTVETCTNGTSQCSSYTEVSQHGHIYSMRFKGCTFDCQNQSMNIGFSKTTYSCCNTDKCNVQDVPDAFNIPNGKKCFSCDGKNCTNIINCSGSEDRCLFVDAGTIRNESVVIKGCVSKSFCDSALVNNATYFRCCEGNLCNGNYSVTQNTTYNGNYSVTQNNTYNGNYSVTLNTTCNGANSVTLSLLFFCCSLLSYFLH